jgi:Tfp pilus assembly protein PilF
MFNSSALTNRRKQFRLLATVVMLFASALMGRAQGGVGSTRGLPDSAGGIHTIQGHVYLPSGRRAGPGILVKLESNVIGTRRIATDTDGSFLINSLPASDYELVIDGGTDFEPVKESVTIYGTTGGPEGTMRSGQTVVLDIHLFPKGTAANEDKLFAGVPKDAIESYKKGMQFARGGESNKAIEQFKRAVTLHPGFGPALNQLGVQYLKLSQPDKAAESLEAAVKAAPDEPEPRLNYGIALLSLKRFPEAEEQLAIALKKNSAAPTAHMYLGIVLVNLHRLEDAQKELETATQSSSAEVSQAHRYLGGVYWGNHDYKRAADELETYLKLAPKAADAERTRKAIKDLRSKQ